MSKLALAADIVEFALATGLSVLSERQAGSHQVTKEPMSKPIDKDQMQQGVEWYERTHKNWRAWGSWFSWGSPVGLGLFFISIAFTIWILSKAFGWN